MGEVSLVKNLSVEGSGSHDNFLVVTGKGKFIFRSVKDDVPVNHTDLGDEYKILKLVEKYSIAPKVVLLDKQHFGKTVLIEEFLEGKNFNSHKSLDEGVLEKTINLLVKVSNLSIPKDGFEFKFSYNDFSGNFKIWEERMVEIEKVLTNNHFLVIGFRQICEQAKVILTAKEKLLKSAPKEFIYNDINPGNLFLTELGEVKLVDWQLVSVGNPALMLSLFARRFGKLWNLEQDEFKDKIFNLYNSKKTIRDLRELYEATILERAVSDMTWQVWANIKQNKTIDIKVLEDSRYYVEALGILTKLN